MDVIRCDEPSYLIWKWRPSGDVNSKSERDKDKAMRENAIRFGSSLRVKDGEVAAFVYPQKNGNFQDFIVGPFDETIKTANFPVLASIIGQVFDDKSPFQAEIYFINIAGITQISFGVPFFDVFDPRFLDFAVPIAVRGKLTFKLVDYKAFIKLHRLINFDLEDFKKQVKSAIAQYVKAVISNAPSDQGIPVLQLDRKILQCKEIIENFIKPRLADEFGVVVSSVDIDAIEADKDNDGYKHLMSVTRDIAAQTTQAQANVSIKNMQDSQAINAKNMEESMRIQRKAAELQVEGANFTVHQLNQQTDVAKIAAESLGKMGQGASMGGGSLNPGAMMAGMAMGGVAGQQMAGMMGNMMQGMNQPSTGGMPPPPPIVQYNVAVNGQTTGPFTLEQLTQMVQSGQFTDKSMVWKAGMTGWVAAGTVQELASLFAQTPPPPPPPV